MVISSNYRALILLVITLVLFILILVIIPNSINGIPRILYIDENYDSPDVDRILKYSSVFSADIELLKQINSQVFLKRNVYFLTKTISDIKNKYVHGMLLSSYYSNEYQNLVNKMYEYNQTFVIKDNFSIYKSLVLPKDLSVIYIIDLDNSTINENTIKRIKDIHPKTLVYLIKTISKKELMDYYNAIAYVFNVDGFGSKLSNISLNIIELEKTTPVYTFKNNKTLNLNNIRKIYGRELINGKLLVVNNIDSMNDNEKTFEIK